MFIKTLNCCALIFAEGVSFLDKGFGFIVSVAVGSFPFRYDCCYHFRTQLLWRWCDIVMKTFPHHIFVAVRSHYG